MQPGESTPFVSTGGRTQDAHLDHTFNEETIAKKTRFYSTGLALSFVVPLVALVAWLATVGHKPVMFNTFAGSPLGGHLTHAEAKAIDVVTSALLVPLVMAGFNLVWFASARVCMASEAPPPGRGAPGQQGGIPFKTLAVASTVGAGT